MSYFVNLKSAKAFYPYNVPQRCFCCAVELDGPIVRYDGCNDKGEGVSIFMHRDCAFAMAQRLIVDAWPNRRDVNHMSIVDK